MHASDDGIMMVSRISEPGHAKYLGGVKVPGRDRSSQSESIPSPFDSDSEKAQIAALNYCQAAIRQAGPASHGERLQCAAVTRTSEQLEQLPVRVPSGPRPDRC